MIPEDLKTVDFLALDDIEKMEFNLKLLDNYNVLIQELMAGRNFAIAGVMSLMLAIQTLDANRIGALLEYSKLLYTSVHRQHEINQATIALTQSQTPPPVDVPPTTPSQVPEPDETTETIDKDGVINVDGKIN